MDKPGADFTDADRYLLDVVRQVNTSHVSVAVTLIVGGLLIRGRIQSLEKFNSGAPGQKLKEHTTLITEAPATPAILNLVDADVNGRKVSWFRVRIGAVDAFTLD